MKSIAFLLGGLTVLIIAAVQIHKLDGHYEHTHRWSLDFAEHKRANFESRDKRAMLIVGGSSSLYAIDTQLLSDQLGAPVYNFGLGANIGLELILEEALETLKPNDTAVLILEPELLATPPHSSQSYVFNHLTDQSLFERRSLYRTLSIIAHSPMSVLIGRTLQTRSDRFANIYQVTSLTSLGDLKESVLNENPPAHPVSTTQLITYSPIHKDNYKVLSLFKKRADALGVRVIAVPAPMIKTEHKSLDYFFEELTAIYQRLDIAHVPGAMILYPAEKAFDTYEHFKPSVRSMHSKQLADLIKMTSSKI